VKVYDPRLIAAEAVSSGPDRPAVAIAHDHADARLVVFRIAPGQQVASHLSSSSVFMTIVSGSGFVSGGEGERAVRTGEVVAIAPREPHGMRAEGEELVIAALIAPRPGGH
jgi:quercetin dioxygenase-like cupin family protein